MKNGIVNIVNFIRGVEPRDLTLDLLEPVRQQLSLLRKHRLTATFLLQYDALIRPEFTSILKSQPDGRFETGIWLEMAQPLVEKAGLTWRGRPGFAWDWHADVGFTIGYSPDERRKLIDTAFMEYKAVFGEYPKSVGSWVIDAQSLAYMTDCYGIVACCNCKDQLGTDGYTLWGGYYGHAYYPSRNNALTPAQSLECQIPVPVFRMLGSDPIYQYDEGIAAGSDHIPWQGVITLEPACSTGGGSPEWVKWFFKENYGDRGMPFGYAQVGQENSFGWEAMEKGYTYQIEYVAEKASEGFLDVQSLGETGAWYRSQFKQTPACCIAAMSDWRNEGRKSIWYYSRHYRINLLFEGASIWIRDIHLFNEAYQERYLAEPCTTHDCQYDTLPAVDGNRWSTSDTHAGLFLMEEMPNGKLIPLAVSEPALSKAGEDGMIATVSLVKGGSLEFRCDKDYILATLDGQGGNLQWCMHLQWHEQAGSPLVGIDENRLLYRYNNFSYAVTVKKGLVLRAEKAGCILLRPENGSIEICLNCDE